MEGLLDHPVVWLCIAALGALFLIVGIFKKDHPTDSETESIKREIKSRYDAMETSLDAFRKFRDKSRLGSDEPTSYFEAGRIEKLVVTDVFVEKAKYKLTLRANFSLRMACLAFLTCLMISMFFIYLVASHSIDFELPLASETVQAGVGWHWAYLILRSLAITSVFLAGIYISASLGKAFLSEWSLLMGRRHSMRFGRLVVFLSERDLTPEELKDSFGWNIDRESSFATFAPDKVTKGIVGQITAAFEKGAEVVAKISSGGDKK